MAAPALSSWRRLLSARLAPVLLRPAARRTDGRVRLDRRAERRRLGPLPPRGGAPEAAVVAGACGGRRRPVARQFGPCSRGRPGHRQVFAPLRLLPRLHRDCARHLPARRRPLVDRTALLARLRRVDAARRRLVLQPQGGGRERQAARRRGVPHHLQGPQGLGRRLPGCKGGGRRLRPLLPCALRDREAGSRRPARGGAAVRSHSAPR
mmetsp:Transcript_27994/g.91190  ORF Transcript_27994/g.91190 Transcript_27994/m.91190 type:complete len:208 (+) Transcript_27994:595-1218(+)